MKYNHYFANHFGSCRLLCTGRDEHRDREVKIFMLPGEFDVVGISDGVDAWIAPANALENSAIREARRQLDMVQSGVDVKPATARVKLKDDVVVTEPTVRRRQLNVDIEDTNTTPRRRILNV